MNVTNGELPFSDPVGHPQTVIQTNASVTRVEMACGRGDDRSPSPVLVGKLTLLTVLCMHADPSVNITNLSAVERAGHPYCSGEEDVVILTTFS